MSGTQSFPAIGRVAPPMNPCRLAAGILLGLLTAVAGVIVERRCAGALVRPLQFVSLWLTVVLIAATAAAIRIGWLRQTRAKLFSPLDWLVMAWTSAAVFASTVVLFLPGISTAGIFAVAMIVTIEEGCAWAWLLRLFPQNNQKTLFQNIPGKDNLSEAVPSDEIVQQITRRRNDDGTEQVFGWIRAAFASGQRTGSVHLSFCPPFHAVPELEVEQTEGPDSRIKTSQVLAYGARLDLKLAEPADEPTAVLLQFVATAAQ